MKKSLMTILLVLAICFTLAGGANATCGTYGRVLYSSQGAGYGYFYVADYLPTTYYYFYTNNVQFIASMTAAQTTGKRIYVSGNATSCPTSGTYMYGGVISNIYIY